MIDCLIRWPDRDTAVACGQAMGCTRQDEGTGEFVTTELFGVINLALIGEYRYITDDSDPLDPVIATVPGWWFLVRVPDDFEVAGTLAALPASLRPEIAWRSDDLDGEGLPPVRPPEIPQTVWA